MLRKKSNQWPIYCPSLTSLCLEILTPRLDELLKRTPIPANHPSSTAVRSLLLTSLSQARTLTLPVLHSLISPQLSNLPLPFSTFLSSEDHFRTISRYCPQLTSINLTGIPMNTNILEIFCKNNPKLTSFTLSRCNVVTDDDILLISKSFLANLQSLKVDECYEVSDAALHHLSQYCANLRNLSVNFCQYITDKGLKSFTSSPILLQTLEMERTSISDSGICNFVMSNGAELRELKLNGCVKIGDTGVNYIVNYCTKLTRLELRECDLITDIAGRNIAQICLNLQDINFGMCKPLGDSTVQYIGYHLKSIKKLNLDRCGGVSNLGLSSLNKCRKLKELCVAGSTIDDQGLYSLFATAEGEVLKPHNFRVIDVSFCKSITIEGVRMLVNESKKLRRMCLWGCNVPEEEVKALEAMRPRILFLRTAQINSIQS
eukprot:TRINITY_DN10731_c0_g1_i1.p1 TRINITY_DN10731_c0_g1~~TRINITY_DN10731_c0_g1_i1.p1  ORF type:complete len:431 (-),score=46.15 TRINITY_DN10731_c0_g1_i1:27-1319(-)